MLESIGDVFLQRKSGVLEGSDIRLFIEQWLRSELMSEKIYCVEVRSGNATIRVGTPLLYQETCLREWDLQEVLLNQLGYTLKRVALVSSYS